MGPGSAASTSRLDIVTRLSGLDASALSEVGVTRSARGRGKKVRRQLKAGAVVLNTGAGGFAAIW